MPRADKKVLIVFVCTLFASWTLYVAIFYRSVEAMPLIPQLLLGETVRFVLFAGIPLFWILRAKDSRLTKLGFTVAWPPVAWGIVIGLLWAFGEILVGMIVFGRQFHPRCAEISFWTTGFRFATLVEEFSFRSFMVGALHYRRPRVAIFVSAACFALIHIPGWVILHMVSSVDQALSMLISIFALGCLLAWVFRRTQSFYAVVIIHALNNVAADALG